MPTYKRKPFEPDPVPIDLKDDEEVFYHRLTNEIFRDYDEYYARVILCNSMVWQCSITGKASLTYQEALDSEKAAKKLLKGFPKTLKRALLHVATLTNRAKLPDIVDDVLAYARDRYFKGEEVLAVIGNLWCPSKVLNVIEPTEEEIEAYKNELVAKGEAEKNDYLKDDTWGPSPDLFRYEVEEVDPDEPNIKEHYILEALDVKREKAALTRDKCKFLFKLAMDYDENKRKFVLKEGVISAHCLNKVKFSDVFIGRPPIFETSLATTRASVNSKHSVSKPRTSVANTSPKSKTPSSTTGKKSPSKSEPKKKMEKKLTPAELKQLELERKASEREKVKAQRKMVADFKKLWFKPKEDLEVEDLKDLPTPDPVAFKIPNNQFGDFMMIMEFMSSYSTFLKVRDCFSSGVTVDILERALTKNEIAGPLSDILQLLLRAVFRLQEGEQAEFAKEEAGSGGRIGLEVNGVSNDVSVNEAIQRATSAAAWSHMYQNTPLYKLVVDYSSVSEVLRLHLLASGAKQSQQSRGSVIENDDPGLHLKIEEPQIFETLKRGTVFDLNMNQKFKVIQCLIHQIISYDAAKDIMDESFELFRQARINYRALVAGEKKKETEDSLWRHKLKADRAIPDINALFKAVAEQIKAEGDDGQASSSSKDKKLVKNLPPPPSNKPQLTDEQIEAQLAKKDKEIARRKQEFAYQEAELMDQINKHERKLGAHPLGRDRAFRRYWVFPTVAGLFVENDDELIGPCLSKPTPQLGEVDLEDMNFIRENMAKLKKVDKEGSDKENSTINSPKKISKKKSILSTPQQKELSRPTVFGLCTGDMDNCPVHCPLKKENNPKWSFFWEPEHIDQLIAGLSSRGLREKDLKQNLEDAKDTLKGLVKKCPVTKLNNDKEYPESISSAPERRSNRGNTSKNQTDPNLGFPPNISISRIMELHLRDLILEFEEKIFHGGLGSLKVKDRLDWRTAIEDSNYAAGTEELCWGGSKILKVDDNNAPGVMICEDQDSEAEKLRSEKAVKGLTCAILQLQQAIELKFMKRPLVERPDEDKKKKKHESHEAAWKTAWNNTNTPLDRWQIAEMKSTSLSQLFVHFYTLESSVEWSKSVLNARCRVCRRKGDPEKMLLCDSCNKGHHIYCLKPMLETLPKGDWFCKDCLPDEPLPTPSKKRMTDKDIMDELESDEESYGDSDGEVQRGSQSKRRLSEEEDNTDEVCHVCDVGGEVICCDSCPLVYHLLCLDPPKTRVPRGTWYCPECTNPKKKSRKTKAPQKKRPVKRKLKYEESEEEESEEREEEESEQDNADSENEEQVVKVKFHRTAKKPSPESSKTRRIVYSDDEEDDDEKSDSEKEEEEVGRHGKRKCASDAAMKISQAAKRLRSDSKENETSENSNDSNYYSGKRSRDDHDDLGADVPKRTRFQRTKNQLRIENGELDNVLLDKLIKDVMKQTDSWPFLKPVTRTEAPDYYDIVKNPMDLGTIKYKLNSMVYSCNEEFISDLSLIFSNCFLYNVVDSEIHQAGLKLKQYCEKRCSKDGINFSDPVLSPVLSPTSDDQHQQQPLDEDD